MSRIEDSAFMPRDVNNKQKTVTLPLEEYEQLINAQKAADAEMRKARQMIEQNQVQLVLHRSKESFYGLCSAGYTFAPKAILPLDCLWAIGPEKVANMAEEIIDAAADHVRRECAVKVSECNAEVERCRSIIVAIDEYNKKGALHRFFNEIKL